LGRLGRRIGLWMKVSGFPRYVQYKNDSATATLSAAKSPRRTLTASLARICDVGNPHTSPYTTDGHVEEDTLTISLVSSIFISVLVTGHGRGLVGSLDLRVGCRILVLLLRGGVLLMRDIRPFPFPSFPFLGYIKKPYQSIS
jgi:hypothetical protein